MARSEKMEIEVESELQRNGYSIHEAREIVAGMRTNELVSAYYHPANLKEKVAFSASSVSTPKPSKINSLAKYE